MREVRLTLSTDSADVSTTERRPVHVTLGQVRLVAVAARPPPRVSGLRVAAIEWSRQGSEWLFAATLHWDAVPNLGHCDVWCDDDKRGPIFLGRAHACCLRVSRGSLLDGAGKLVLRVQAVSSARLKLPIAQCSEVVVRW